MDSENTLLLCLAFAEAHSSESDVGAAMRLLASEVRRLCEENKFLHDAMDAFEWQRINSMSASEVTKELLAAGYTDERINAGLAKIRAIADVALAKRGIHP